MLSTETIKNVGQAAHYFLGQDNYYLDDEGKECSEWWGQGAKALKLAGKVDERIFTALLQGRMPDGQQLGSKEGGEIKHRPGVDLTFSAPKSVSIAALLGEDKRIFTALSRATDNVLNHIEQDCAKARVTQAGITTYQNTQKLVVAKFLHDISREGDPQLHIHCIVMNMTLRSDGKWRSLASQSGAYGAHATHEIQGFLERVRHHKHYYGLLFRAELAYELKQLGYAIIKKEKGCFEIDSISEQNMLVNSTRRRQIEAYMKAHGYSGAKAAAVATLKTRKAKTINRETLQALWQARNEAHQLDGLGEAKQVVAAALNANPCETRQALPNADLVVARKAVEAAMAYLSETQVAMQKVQLVNVTLQYTLGERVNVEAIVKAIDEQQAKGELIPLDSPSARASFTTKRLLAYEQATLQSLKQVNKHTQPLLPTDKIASFLSGEPQLTAEQQQAIRTLFSSTAKVMALEGATGTGKTTLIKPMMALARLGGYQPLLLTPSKASAIHLQQAFRSTPKNLWEWLRQLLNSNQYDTVAGFLKKQERSPQSLSKHIIFVDKAMLLASKPMHDLVQHVQKATMTRLIVIDDSKSLLSWQTGIPFLQMLQHGITKASLTQDLRLQHNSIKTAIAATRQNDIVNAFEKIGHRIIALEDKAQRLEAMAAHFAALTSAEQKNTLVLMPNKQQCQEITLAIRQALKQRTIISQAGISVEALLPKNLREVEYGYAKSYQRGQVVRFNNTYVSLQVVKGEYCRVKEIKHAQNRVILENAKGRLILWDPAKVAGQSGKVELFEVQMREVAVGDVLTWQRHDIQKKIHKGQRLHVTKIKGQRIHLTQMEGKSIQINLKATKDRHFDYGYASTLYQTSEINAPLVIAYQASFARQSHQRHFYKTLAQATEQIWLYTENRQQLLSQIQKQTGDKATALEALLGHSYSPKAGAMTYALLEKTVSEAIKALQQKGMGEKTPEQLAQEAVQYAVAHLAEREAAFSHPDVMQVALKYVLGDVRSKAMEAAILAAANKGELIRGLYSSNGTYWTTREALAIERAIRQLASEHKGKLAPFASPAVVANHLQKNPLKEDHQQAIRTIASCQDRIVLIQGYAGTGKTTLLKSVEGLLQAMQALLNQQGQQLLCLAPTHSAVKELRERQLEAQTADSFIAECKLVQTREGFLPHYQYQRVVAVDESSMLSNRRLHDLLTITQLTQTRLLIVGDEKQYQAIESGKPFSSLLHSGLTVAYLTAIERQKNQIVKKAVGQVYNNEFAAAFKTLASHIIEIGQEQMNGKTVDNRHKRLEAISEDYLSRPLIERAQTMVITLGNDDREMLNALIREGLKSKGELVGDRIISSILVPRDMSKAELMRSANYKIGDIVRFNYTDQACGIQKNHYLSVKAINQEQNLLTLQKGKGERVIWNPPRNLNEQGGGVEVYARKERELQAGDLIRWTRTDKKLGFLSPDLVSVERVSQDKCLFREIKLTDKGIIVGDKVFEIYPHKQAYQHWDHAYAVTGYSAQGKSIQFVILHLESFRPYLASQPSLLVMLTRAVQGLVIYTDNQKELLRVILGNKGEKSSALETVGEWQQLSHTMPPTPSHVMPIPAYKERPANTLKNAFVDVRHISKRLKDNAEHVLERLLGEPTERSARQYRYGSHQGSLVVTLAGDKRGLWHDFQTGEGGDLLQLIAKQAGLAIKVKKDFKKAIDQALSILGISAECVRPQNKINRHTTITKPIKSKGLTKAQKYSLDQARRLAKQSQPLENTLAERYLQEHRGITLKKFPESFRFHPQLYSSANGIAKPALVVIAKDSKGHVQAVQAIFLDVKTANKATVKVPKQTWGILAASGASVSIHNPQAKWICVAEGPETALSIYQAMPNADVKITLSKANFKHVDTRNDTRPIVLCLDNDGDNPSTDKLLHFAAEKLVAEGKHVWIAKPEQIGQDYNDVLKEQGVQAVRKSIEAAVCYEAYRDPKKSTGLTLKIARMASENLKCAGVLGNAEVIKHFQATKSTHTLNFSTEKLHALADKFLASERDKWQGLFEAMSSKTSKQIAHKNHEALAKNMKIWVHDKELER